MTGKRLPPDEPFVGHLPHGKTLGGDACDCAACEADRARARRVPGARVPIASPSDLQRGGKTLERGIGEHGTQLVMCKPHLPALMPDLRRFLLSCWADDGPFYAAAPSIGVTSAHLGWERRTLEEASLWWVAPDMVDVLIAAAAAIPDEVTAYELEPLARCGLVLLGKPWEGISTTEGQEPVEVDAFLWGPTNLPSLGPAREAVSLSAYTSFPPEPDLMLPVAKRWMLRDQMWAPLGRSDWPLGDPIERAPWPMGEQSRLSFVEDRRILCALMTLLAHEGIATTYRDVPPRGDRRRYERAHGGARDYEYRVVTLRTLPHDEREPTATGGRRVEHDHRWPVGLATGGFPRRQPYGPGRSQRKLIWVFPYVKGPADKPLRVKEVIHAWRR